MTTEFLLGAYIFVFAIFIGFEMISKIPTILHTPLMSGTNAIHGIVLIAAMAALGSAQTPAARWIGLAAVIFAAANAFGGLAVTDRMLKMFTKKSR